LKRKSKKERKINKTKIYQKPSPFRWFLLSFFSSSNNRAFFETAGKNSKKDVNVCCGCSLLAVQVGEVFDLKIGLLKTLCKLLLQHLLK
jgi:hypothetical protein